MQISFAKNDVKILTISWNLYSLETISGPFPAPSLQAAYLQAAAVRHFPGRYANAYCQPILYNSRTNRCSRIWGRRFQGSIGGFYRSQNKYGAMSVFFARTPEKLNNDESLLSGKHTGFYQDRCSRFFCAQTPKGFEDISSRKVETRNEIQTKTETRRASKTFLPTVPQAQREAAFE